jgi:DNA-binding beta-propeller fold protein YncE
MLTAAIMTLALTAPAAAPAPRPETRLEWSYLFKLATSTGVVASSWATLALDPKTGELFMLDGSEGLVRIFNDAGMETYEFGDDAELGQLVSAAPLPDGHILVVALRGEETEIIRCNYRGEREDVFRPSSVPSRYTGMRIDAIYTHGDKVYLADTESFRVIATNDKGVFQRGYDLAAATKLDEKKRASNTIVGLNVDGAGNILFTIPTLFQAFVLSPSGELRAFGTRGSAPGRFNIVGGIAADEQGYVYVSDLLRSVVMVFDREFEFLGEFGYRGDDQASLVSPRVVLAARGRLYVSQSAGRGVSVFNVTPKAPVEPEPVGATR